MHDKISSLDLSQINNYMVKAKGWKQAQANEAENQYKNFLRIKIVATDSFSQELVPSLDIDEFWHAHILHTEKYAADMQNICGKFLHHHPQQESEININYYFDITQKLYYLMHRQYMTIIRKQLYQSTLSKIYEKIINFFVRKENPQS